jgi:hypothetical protein
MKRVLVDHFGGPDVLSVVEDDDPRPGHGEVRLRVLAAGVSFTDAQIRAGTYMGGPKPPFTPGYELVGIVEELGPGCSRLREGDRIGALMVWGADAESVCVPEKYAVAVPEDLDPAEVVSLIFPYMTAYQMLHRTARVQPGETVLVHGAARPVSTRSANRSRPTHSGWTRSSRPCTAGFTSSSTDVGYRRSVGRDWRTGVSGYLRKALSMVRTIVGRWKPTGRWRIRARECWMSSSCRS